MIQLSSMGYNNSLIADAYKLSSERIRQIFDKENWRPPSRVRNPVSKPKETFIKELGKLKLSINEIHSLIPTVSIQSIRNVLGRGYQSFNSHIERELKFKESEICYLAECGFGVVEIINITKTHQSNVKKILEQNGFNIIKGSGIQPAINEG